MLESNIVRLKNKNVKLSNSRIKVGKYLFKLKWLRMAIQIKGELEVVGACADARSKGISCVLGLSLLFILSVLSWVYFLIPVTRFCFLSVNYILIVNFKVAAIFFVNWICKTRAIRALFILFVLVRLWLLMLELAFSFNQSELVLRRARRFYLLDRAVARSNHLN